MSYYEIGISNSNLPYVEHSIFIKSNRMPTEKEIRSIFEHSEFKEYDCDTVNIIIPFYGIDYMDEEDVKNIPEFNFE